MYHCLESCIGVVCGGGGGRRRCVYKKKRAEMMFSERDTYIPPHTEELRSVSVTTVVNTYIPH